MVEDVRRRVAMLLAMWGGGRRERRQRVMLLVAATQFVALRTVGGVLPSEGIVRGRVHIVPSRGIPVREEAATQLVLPASEEESSWGDGSHPTTALCLEYLSSRSWSSSDRLLDMGCGSAVLCMAARRLGCPSCAAVDIEDEVLESATRNARLNEIDAIDFQHARSVVPGEGAKANVAVANILVGPLSRPSMIATLAFAVEAGGELCLSGFRPGDQAELLRDLYAPYFDFDDELYSVREPDDFGKEYWGDWARLVGRRRHESAEGADARRRALDDLSDAALG